MEKRIGCRLNQLLVFYFGLATAGLALGQQVSAPAKQEGYAIVQRDFNSRVWQRSELLTNAFGVVRTKVHSYTELRSGLCHNENGVWVDSTEQIDLVADGAQAVHGAHRVHWNANVNAQGGTVHLVTSCGEALDSQVYGISYWDTSTGTNLLIASLQDSQGMIVGNEAIYTNSFGGGGGIDADIVYTYTVEGLEQNIVFRAQLPDPSVYGLDAEHTVVQVLTEFFNPPAVTKVAGGADGAENDECIDFGDMTINVGNAFLAPDQGGMVTAGEVRKYWGPYGGRNFLIEEIPFPQIAALQGYLPAHASISKPSKKITRLALLERQRLAPPKDFGALLLAKTYRQNPALVLDYSIVNTTNYLVFQGDTTYFVSGNVSLSGTNVYEGGAVIKFATNGSITESSSPRISFLTGAYRPLVFSAKDDDSVGEVISGSTGNPRTNFYANPALNLGSAVVGITNIRVSYASQAISASSASTIMDAQFVSCSNGISENGQNLTVKNALFANVIIPFNSLGGAGTAITAENATFANAKFLATFTATNTGTALNLTNGIFSQVTNTVGYPASAPAPYAGYTPAANANGFYGTTSFGSGSVASSSYPFQTVGAAGFYLASGSAFLNAATTNLDAALAADLARKTVSPPLTNFLIGWLTNSVTLTPQAARDTGVPSLGYHYEPIDWVVLMALSNATVTVTAGTAVAAPATSYGICPFTGGTSVAFQGTATAPCYFFKYNLVQEQSNPNWVQPSPGSWFGLLCPPFQTHSPACTANFRFTVWSALADDSLIAATGVGLTPVVLQDCQLYNGFMWPVTCQFASTNCLYQRDDFEPYDDSGVQVHNFFNNLFVGGAFQPSEGGTASTFKDNLFDHTWIYFADGPPDVCSNNAYVTTNFGTLLSPTNVHDIVLASSPAYQAGALGQYYYPTNLSLIHAGSRLASAAGLYHYTVITNTVNGIEGTNQVSIGFHYVATDASGNPLDVDGDSQPDYLEDLNGNGLVDGTETSWTNYNSFNGLVTPNGLVVFTPLK